MSNEMRTVLTIEEARAVCKAAVAAIDELAAVERYTPFSKWYKGEHARARSAARKAVSALRSDDAAETAMVAEWLEALRNKEPTTHIGLREKLG